MAERRFLPPALIKATEDEVSYAIGLHDGSVVEFKSAELVGDIGWVRLCDTTAMHGPIAGQSFSFERGVEVAIDAVVWAPDAPHRS